MPESNASPSAPARAPLTVTLPSDREILLTRVFDPPRRLVFEAHTRPEHLRHWWGPRVEARDGHLRSGMEAGASETLDRLAEHLRAMA